VTAPVKLAAFAAVVAAAFGLGFGAGDLAGPFGDAPASEAPMQNDHDMEDR
jgi:hypothetical protein